MSKVKQPDTIFIQGLPPDVTPDQLSDHFGSIGIIKMDRKTNEPRIWIYKHKDTGRGKGEATITFVDESSATAAISWFNAKDFQGSRIDVTIAERFMKEGGFAARGGGGGRGGGGRGYGGGGGGGGENIVEAVAEDMVGVVEAVAEDMVVVGVAVVVVVTVVVVTVMEGAVGEEDMVREIAMVGVEDAVVAVVAVLGVVAVVDQRLAAAMAEVEAAVQIEIEVETVGVGRIKDFIRHLHLYLQNHQQKYPSLSLTTWFVVFSPIVSCHLKVDGTQLEYLSLALKYQLVSRKTVYLLLNEKKQGYYDPNTLVLAASWRKSTLG